MEAHHLLKQCQRDEVMVLVAMVTALLLNKVLR